MQFVVSCLTDLKQPAMQSLVCLLMVLVIQPSLGLDPVIPTWMPNNTHGFWRLHNDTRYHFTYGRQGTHKCQDEHDTFPTVGCLDKTKCTKDDASRVDRFCGVCVFGIATFCSEKAVDQRFYTVQIDYKDDECQIPDEAGGIPPVNPWPTSPDECDDCCDGYKVWTDCSAECEGPGPTRVQPGCHYDHGKNETECKLDPKCSWVKLPEISFSVGYSEFAEYAPDGYMCGTDVVCQIAGSKADVQFKTLAECLQKCSRQDKLSFAPIV